MYETTADIQDFFRSMAWTLRTAFSNVKPFPECVNEFILSHKLLTITQSDILIIILFAIVTYSIRSLLTENIVNMGKISVNLSDRTIESLWYISYYTFATALNIRNSRKYQIFSTRYHAFRDFPSRELIPFELRIFRFMQIGFYVNELYRMMTAKKRNSDFHVMMLHHFFSIYLALLSYGMRLMFAGLIVETLHDVNDIFLHAAKISNYFNLSDKKFIYELAGDCGFVIFTCSW
ncbi:ASC1-like protein 2 [Thelohanellus kitauei]|uniref:ASC1-like protein 2 n=1 Tax=Thelohanellus kitauei TaxID=669202 RepID=A0A0C2MSG9_THEKT|nr:ASC1-like protein 2 [Thelohanellus kitauei]